MFYIIHVAQEIYLRSVLWLKKYLKKIECLPGSGIGVIGLSGNKIPFWTSSSLLARTEIFLSKAVTKI